MSREQVAAMFPGASKSTLEKNGLSTVHKDIAADIFGADFPRVKPRMNKTEAEYERMLIAANPGATIRYEAYTLKLAEGCRYIPDFAVEHPDGRLEFHEVKGAFIFSKALTKPKTAAELFPQRFYLAQKIKGNWTITQLPGKIDKHG